MPWSERDNWPASTVAMLPDSVMAAWMASLRSCQIVHPTAVADTPSSRIAACHRRRSGMDSRAAPAVGSIGDRAPLSGAGMAGTLRSIGLETKPARRAGPHKDYRRSVTSFR